MTEKTRILNNNNGELPNGPYAIVHVKQVENAAETLNTVKQTMLAFLDNQQIEEEDRRWEQLLPQRIIEFTRQLDEDDYGNDELLSHIPSMIYKLKEIRKWEWYSSKLTTSGFAITVTAGVLGVSLLPLLHHHGIPHACIFTEKNKIEYPVRARIDVLSYKTFDPITLKLERKTEV